ncbi:hypothetical protein RQP46_001897 [Phenoliferia psychrophenolica]
MATKPFPRGLRDRIPFVVRAVTVTHRQSVTAVRGLTSFLLFTACWTFLGAVLHWLVNLYVGGFWTVLTLVFWAVATDLWSHVEDFHPSDCDGSSIASFCRRVVAIEAIGWTELALTALLLLAVIFHWHSGGRKDNYRSAGYRGFYV